MVVMSLMDEIVQRYAPLVWSICGRFQLSASDCEGVAQKVRPLPGTAVANIL
jgi:hypothetical protein